MKTTFVTVLLTCSALLSLASLGSAQLLPAPAADPRVGLGLAPMRVEIKMVAGQVYSNTLKLSSGAGEKLRVRGEVLDFQVDDKATPQFERDLPAEARVSCKHWLTLNPTEIELDKEGFLNVRYSLRLPADVAEGSYACAAGFTTLPSAEAVSEGVGMRMAVRIVSTIYVQVGAPPVSGGLKQLTLERIPGSKEADQAFQAVAVVENRGRMYFRPSGKLELQDDAGKVVSSFEFPSLPVLRERDQRILFPLKSALVPGKYQLRAQVDIGLKELQQGQVEIVIDPPAAAAEVLKAEVGTQSASGQAGAPR